MGFSGLFKSLININRIFILMKFSKILKLMKFSEIFRCKVDINKNSRLVDLGGIPRF